MTSLSSFCYSVCFLPAAVGIKLMKLLHPFIDFAYLYIHLFKYPNFVSKLVATLPTAAESRDFYAANFMTQQRLCLGDHELWQLQLCKTTSRVHTENDNAIHRMSQFYESMTTSFKLCCQLGSF